MKKIPLLFLSVLLLCSCSKEPSFELTGSWKLTNVSYTQNSEQIIQNYAPYNIIYEFKAGGVLTVSGETNQIDFYLGHETGDHFYATSKVGVLIGNDVKIDNNQKGLIIGDYRYTVIFSDGKNSTYFSVSNGEKQIWITDSEHYSYMMTKIE